MATASKQRASQLYEGLIQLYPASFRKKYQQTMSQTFSDMLAAEPSRLRKLLIWAQALIDVPRTAAKEHITNGKDVHMNRNIKLTVAGSLIVVVVVGLAAYWQGNLRARGALGVERVTTAQLADAMQHDDFYSTYGDAAVLFNGTIASVKSQGNVALVTFATNRPYNVVCQFPQATKLTAGQTVSVAAPAGSAERQAHGVLLHNCIEN